MNDNNFTPTPVVEPKNNNPAAQQEPGAIVVEEIPEYDYQDYINQLGNNNYQTPQDDTDITQENTNTTQEDVNTEQPNINTAQEAPQNPQDDTENQEEEDLFTCPICMEELHDPVATPCGHVFCRRCIEEWLIRSECCPNCNAPNITKDSLITIRGQGEAENRPEFDNSYKNNRWYHKTYRYFKKNYISILIIILFCLVCLVD
ncbi:hypothetical protein TVAG_059670 [Trichomonas vaginalis G3]|uniref:RING-type domain-containing protein n=1 Tax=Trichomonas vaginalis (strain ATCC PRA-98 / G3) TaxID=412133 RepID=A2FB19_TRIV3|nr:ER-associated misfolded protein catabolic process [Trichomonas vaginalis G3]EAX97902.1 hypothetical protein TVAG_059670 [Trichomonas vaginalis G3]KAI5509853.1 ER-associated misfolded protein catabolic process [Trichomonas vaginalis G3]|eukprot:XP_001310832.1 hypothetical protein [Trichomonas vaginalis G3]